MIGPWRLVPITLKPHIVQQPLLHEVARRLGREHPQESESFAKSLRSSKLISPETRSTESRPRRALSRGAARAQPFRLEGKRDRLSSSYVAGSLVAAGALMPGQR
jgi:hypothetical protein